ncbi:hypothetical protein [Galbitalea soli]|uniref:Uncharacterized protein n=1 Tax=Galbitalea soli TaxID=1268042 RepID=A0A7C9TQX9_9MICO|nr:hypothetical protein [Galbitalea soli]NEM91475.1 hypothetical protein [Galbitalea soli]NYJ30168.1 hypothetical protein [Galbitalea soli]
MAELYDVHLAGEGAVFAVVADEVRGWSSAHVAPGDPHRISGVKRAGSGAVARYGKTLLSTAIPTPVPEPATISAIRQDLEDHVARKRPGRTLRANGHAGETDSVHETAVRSLRFVSNDDGARHVAGARSVAHESFADIARRLVSCQQDVKPKQVLRELQRLVREGVDIGDVVNSVLDLRWASQ